MSTKASASTSAPVSAPSAATGPTAGQTAVVSVQQSAQHAASANPGVLSGFGRGGPKGLGRGEKDPAWLKVLYIVGSIFVPPIVVLVKTGDPCETGLNVLWWMLGWFPAVVHSLIVISGDTRCACITDCALDVTPGSRLSTLVDNNVTPAPAPTARPPIDTAAKDAYDGPRTGGTSATVSPVEPARASRST